MTSTSHEELVEDKDNEPDLPDTNTDDGEQRHPHNVIFDINDAGSTIWDVYDASVDDNGVDLKNPSLVYDTDGHTETLDDNLHDIGFHVHLSTMASLRWLLLLRMWNMQ